MTQEELLNILKQSGIPIAYHHFDGESPLPCVVYYRTDNDNVLADNKVHISFKNYNVELYTPVKSKSLEEKIEKIFDDNEIVYEVDETYLESERVYEVIYFIQI